MKILKKRTVSMLIVTVLLAMLLGGVVDTDLVCADVNESTGQYPTVYSINLGTRPLYAISGGWNSTDGVKVYYGNNLFRVLGSSNQTQSVSKDSVLLNKDYRIEEYASFSDSGNKWTESNTRNYLNNNYYNTAFSNKEKQAILDTTLEEVETYTVNGANYIDVPSVDKIFALSAMEANDLYEDNAARTWGNHSWLRSSDSDNTGNVASVYGGGAIETYNYGNPWIRVSPAFNLDKSVILFTSAQTMDKTSEITEDSTAISESSYTGNKTWKLTLKDSSKSIKVWQSKSVTVDDEGQVNIPFDYITDTDNEVNQVSIMITDEAYDAVNAKILYYGKLAVSDLNRSISGSITEVLGNGNFILPEDLRNKSLGTDYHMYIIAECVNTDTYTDYASSPKEITLNDVVDVITYISVPNPITVANGTAYADMGLPDQVNIRTMMGKADAADVVWDTSEPISGSYDSAVTEEQNITLKGTLIIPEGVVVSQGTPVTTIAVKIDKKQESVNKNIDRASHNNDKLTAAPQTGDDSELIKWKMILIIAVMGVVFINNRKRCLIQK